MSRRRSYIYDLLSLEIHRKISKKVLILKFTHAYLATTPHTYRFYHSITPQRNNNIWPHEFNLNSTIMWHQKYHSTNTNKCTHEWKWWRNEWNLSTILLLNKNVIFTMWHLFKKKLMIGSLKNTNKYLFIRKI